MSFPRLLNTNEVAKLLGVQPQTLRVWRLTGKGPAYVRMGDTKFSRAAYEDSVVTEWVNDRRFQSSGDEEK